MWGAQEKSEGAHQKNFRLALRAGIVPPPTCKLLTTPLYYVDRCNSARYNPRVGSDVF